MDWRHLDEQMQQWSTRLRDDLKIEPPESNRLATTIAAEVAALPDGQSRACIPRSGLRRAFPQSAHGHSQSTWI